MIKHLWFDFSDTLVRLDQELHNRLRYGAYSEIVGRPLNQELIDEYETLYRKLGHSNAAIFRSLGKSSQYWSEQVNSVPSRELYKLADKNVPQVMAQLKDIVPVSLFSNIQGEKILETFGIPAKWFTYILTGGLVKEPKPALEGFHKMVELSSVPARDILYVGDDLEKDVQPAKQVGITTGIIWNSSDEADHSFTGFPDLLNFVKQNVSEV